MTHTALSDQHQATGAESQATGAESQATGAESRRSSGMNVIEAIELRKSYGTGPAEVEALRGVSLAIGQGELAAIVGPSGSGKSTLLSLLGAVDTPTSGKVLIENVDLATLNDDQRTLLRRRRIGFVFQAFNLLPNLTAIENVALPMELDGAASSRAYERATHALSLVGMTHRKGHLPSQLSGGEQQRVAIARALVIQPALVLADEPTGNLDSTNSRLVVDLLHRLVDDDGQTVVMVTHDPEVAAQARRAIHIRDGKVVEDGVPAEVVHMRVPQVAR
jgi:putative ABC transport system ATP-binding protein